ncbi:MAG: hypothetical protein LC781_10940, partial [Actinobacteria bacterium]|nr:hypothetical protein [Actinomycetota bacterium]
MNDSKNERGETANSVRERLAPWLVNMALLLMALELGGSLYERLVVDPAWTTNLAIIQPDSGGMNRKAFWIPLHGALTLLLPIALWACWHSRAARRWLLAALGVYLAMRAWTFAYFIPLAIQFEAAEEFSVVTPSRADSSLCGQELWPRPAVLSQSDSHRRCAWLVVPF